MINGILALDLDGVIADTWIGHLRRDIHLPPEVHSFIEQNPDIVGPKVDKLNPYDLKSVQVDSVLLIAEIIHKCNLGVVVVSSWASSLNPDCYKQVFKLFQHVYPELNEENWLGQTAGISGNGREEQFLNFIRSNFNIDDPKHIIAIDDSGSKHFPKLTPNTVAPIGRIGFTVDDYIKAIRILDYNDEQWYDWSFKGYVKELINFKAFDKDVLWKMVHEDVT